MTLRIEDPVYVKQTALATYPSQLRHYVGVAGRVVHVSGNGVADVKWPDLGCLSSFHVDELSNVPEAVPRTSPPPRYVD